MARKTLQEYRKGAHEALEAHYFDRPAGLLLVIAYKGLWGMAEIVSGTLLIVFRTVIAAELSDDPQDLLANWLYSHLETYHVDPLYVGSIVIGFGLIKVILAMCLWYRFALIREIGLVFFSLVGAYGVYYLTLQYSQVTFFALLFDLCALYYFWKILPKHLTKKMIYE